MSRDLFPVRHVGDDDMPPEELTMGELGKFLEANPGRHYIDGYRVKHEGSYDFEIPDLPEGDDGRPGDWPDPPVPGADDA